MCAVNVERREYKVRRMTRRAIARYIRVRAVNFERRENDVCCMTRQAIAISAGPCQLCGRGKAGQNPRRGEAHVTRVLGGGGDGCE